MNCKNCGKIYGDVLKHVCPAEWIERQQEAAKQQQAAADASQAKPRSPEEIFIAIAKGEYTSRELWTFILKEASEWGKLQEREAAQKNSIPVTCSGEYHVRNIATDAELLAEIERRGLATRGLELTLVGLSNNRLLGEVERRGLNAVRAHIKNGIVTLLSASPGVTVEVVE